VEEACNFFANQPKIARKLQTLQEVGLGYVQLGQSATTLSGGEAQRVKLANELARRDTGKTVYILDEPTTGLHIADVHRLVKVLDKLADAGNTVIVIEHNLDVIKRCRLYHRPGAGGRQRRRYHCGNRYAGTGSPEPELLHRPVPETRAGARLELQAQLRPPCQKSRDARRLQRKKPPPSRRANAKTQTKNNHSAVPSRFWMQGITLLRTPVRAEFCFFRRVKDN